MSKLSYTDWSKIGSDAIWVTHDENRKYARPDEEGMKRLEAAMTRFDLSARAYDRILKVARTIADLDGSEAVLTRHITEAIGYRNLDRGDWASRRI